MAAAEDSEAEELSARLARLAARARLSSGSEAGEDAEGEAAASGRPSAAADALRRLLEDRTGALNHVQQDLGMGGWLSRSRPASSRAVAAPPPEPGAAPPRPAQGDGAAAEGRGGNAGGAAGSAHLAPQDVVRSSRPEQGVAAHSETARPSHPPALVLTRGAAGIDNSSPAQPAQLGAGTGALEEELRRQAEAEAARAAARAARERELREMQAALGQQRAAAGG